MELMEVDSVANNRLFNIYSAGFTSLMCLCFQSPYLFKTNLTSLLMVVTTQVCHLCPFMVFYKLSSKEVGGDGKLEQLTRAMSRYHWNK